MDALPPGMARVLAVSAHPDDVEFFAGGTLARLADQGARIALVVCTDGRRGGRELEAAASIRRREQEAAARPLGIAELSWMGREDGLLRNDCELQEGLVAELRRHRPELVLGHDPRTFWKTYGERTAFGHSDHRAAGAALLDAIYPRSSNPNFFPGVGGEPWRPHEVWLFDCCEPSLVIDVSSGFDRKLEALRAHASQAAAGGGLTKAAEALGAYYGDAQCPERAVDHKDVGAALR